MAKGFALELTPIHMIQPIRRLLLHDRTTLRMIDPHTWNINITVSDIHPSGKQRRALPPTQQVLARRRHQLGSDVVVRRICYQEGVVDAHDARVLAAADGFPGLRGSDDGRIEAGEGVAVSTPGEADGGGEGGVLGAVEEEDCGI